MSEHFIPPNAKFTTPDPEELEPKYAPEANTDKPFDDEKDTRRCKDCGGYGRGLLQSDGRCAHCRRKGAVKYDPSTCPHAAKGFVDITRAADGGVLKKVVTLPPNRDDESTTKDLTPSPGCPCKVHIVGTLTNGEIFQATRDMYTGPDGVERCIGGDDNPLEFHLLREKVVRGLDVAVSTMVLGEVSSFVVRGDYGYVRQLPESLPKVTMNATLIYEVELLEFGEAIPRFPSKEELAQTKREREEENKQMLKENPPVPYAERCEEAMKEKELGNELFKEGKYEEAKKQYDSGFIHVYIHHDEWNNNHMMNDEQRKTINDTKAVLHLNRCMCRVKMEKWDDALWDADKAVQFSGKPGNPKAYYRRMVIYTGHLKRELAKEKEGKFWEIDKGKRWARCARRDLTKCLALNKEQAPEGSELRKEGEDGVVRRGRLDLERLEQQLKRYENAYQKSAKKLYSEKMMGGLNEKYENLKIKKDKRRAEEEENMDMPELDDSDEEGQGEVLMPPVPPPTN
ncbi:hypothetical protein TeGR_g9818 [Tetraparma gracilis]|uniref:peptidylprolyl isomerase n=1 Tax=Tetraparma gracilis TaxID=2962635 RepID=A0ABQ6MT53_9STRA|nr:hypothetical protein TeGR_g9818 [Tetraparma gracilis]